MWEKLLLAIGLTFTLHLCTQIGLFSLSQTTLEKIPNQTLWVVAQDN
jgi:hypothetical protein